MTYRSIRVTAGLAMLGACSGGDPTEPMQNQITPPGASFSCSVVEMGVGEVRTALTGGNFCLTADAASEYMVNAFFGSAVATGNTQVTVTGFGITTGTSGGASTSLSVPTDMSAFGGSTPRQSLELAFRAYEQNVLEPRIAGARAAYRNRATFATVPTTVGAQVQLNASSAGCTNPNMRTARVVAVSNRAIIVADESNPAGGFTSTEFASIATTFDTLVDPLARANFGDPSDIDGNSRIVIFYTRVVNELTPAESQGVVEGFFNPRDLFPQTGTAQLQGCAGSNVAEMFYMIVPDPTGVVNGNVRTKADVQQSTISVVAHEYQHLINASRRIYVNNADDFEEVWLNEGLSHIAEELLFYRTSGLSPRSNIDAPAITNSQQRVDAFNQHQVGNFGRYLLLLQRPETSSPYADNDSLSNRGAIWSFLRYAADRKGGSEVTLWQQLVNSNTMDMPNLTQVFGSDLMSWFRDWSISVYADDKVGTSAQWQQPSWNFRSIYPRLGFNTFPLVVRPLTNASPQTVTVGGGGSLYMTFGVPAGGQAGVSWTAGSPNVAFSIVRTK